MKKKVGIVLITFLVILGTFAAYCYVGHSGAFMCIVGVEADIAQNVQIPQSLIGKSVPLEIPHVDSARLVVDDVRENIVYFTLNLHGVQGRERFHLLPSEWKANGGTADYWEVKPQMAHFRSAIAASLSNQGLPESAIIACRVDFPRRYHLQ